MFLPTSNKKAELESLKSYGHEVLSFTAETVASPQTLVLSLPVSDSKTVTATYYYVTNKNHLKQAIAWVADKRVVALDLETSGLDPFEDRIATLQLGRLTNGEAEVFVVDVRLFSQEDLQPLFSVLEDVNVCKLGQNIRFEYRFLRSSYGVRCKNVADTQVAEMAIRCGLFSGKKKGGKGSGERIAYQKCSMAALMRRYASLDIDKDKDLRTSFYKTAPGKHNLRQIVYAGSDVIYPFVIAQKQKVLIQERKLSGVVKVEMRNLPVIAEREHRGFLIDQNKWRALWQEALQKRADAEKQLDEIIRPATVQPDLFDTADSKARPIYPPLGRVMNYSSSDQVRWVLKWVSESRNWPVKPVTSLAEVNKLKRKYGEEWVEWQEKKGRVVADEDIPEWVIPEDKYCVLLSADKDVLTLAKCRKQLPADIVDLLLTYSRYDVRCSSFGNEWLRKNVNKKTGRIHTEVHQLVTTTGRTSTSPNLQNIPSDPRYRECFIPGKGFKFVICDYSQQEPRLLAYMSKDPVYVGTFLRDEDLYLEVAENMLGHRPDKSTPEGKFERKIFKIVVLAMAYRSGIRKLRDQLTLAMEDDIMSGKVEAPTYEYAKSLHEKFFVVHEKVLEFQNECSNGSDPKNKTARRFYDEMVGAEVTYVRAPCGRLRLFPPDSKNTYTEGANAPIQGGSATMTKAAEAKIQDMIYEKGWQDLAFIVNSVHDEIVSEVHDSIAQEYGVLKKQIMEDVGTFYCPGIPFVANYPETNPGPCDYWAK